MVQITCVPPSLGSKAREGRAYTAHACVAKAQRMPSSQARVPRVLTGPPLRCSSWPTTHSLSWGTGSTPSALRTTSRAPCRSTRISSTFSPLCCSCWGTATDGQPIPVPRPALGSRPSRGLSSGPCTPLLPFSTLPVWLRICRFLVGLECRIDSCLGWPWQEIGWGCRPILLGGAKGNMQGGSDFKVKPHLSPPSPMPFSGLKARELECFAFPSPVDPECFGCSTLNSQAVINPTLFL